MQEAALDPDYESLSWSDSDDYDQYVNEELADSRSAKWVALVSRLAGCSLEGKTVLDLGCGPGFFPCTLGAEGAKVYGIDTSDNMLACARANAEKRGVNAVMLHMDAESLSFPEATFDLVVTRNVTWTLPNPVAAYRECLKVLKPGGKLLVFDANWHHEFYSEAVAQKVRENEAAYYRETGIHTAVCTNDKPYYDSLPLSSVVRPAWDADALMQVGFDGITVIEDAGKEVYLDWEYELYGASPLFAVAAEKPVAAVEGNEAFNVLKATRDYWNERSNTFGLDGSIDKWGDLIQQKLLQRGVTSPWVLDAGCGTGAMALTLASRGYRVCGVDFSQGMLLHARMNAKHQGLEIPLVLGCVDQLPFVSETFDVVVSRNVLSNLAVAKEALESWRDALRPGGYLVYFDSSWWHYLHEESLDAKRALAYGTGSSPIFNVLEELAKDMPIAAADRPAWDVMALRSLGFEVEAVEDVSSRVWTAEEQQRYEFAPQFMVVARKPVR